MSPKALFELLRPPRERGGIGNARATETAIINGVKNGCSNKFRTAEIPQLLRLLVPVQVLVLVRVILVLVLVSLLVQLLPLVALFAHRESLSLVSH